MDVEELVQEVTDLLTEAIDRKAEETRASMLYCRQALEAIVEYLWVEKYDESPGKELFLAPKIKQLNPRRIGLFWNVNDKTKPHIHWSRGYRNDQTEVMRVIGWITDIMKKSIGREIELEPIDSPLLQEFESQLDELKSETTDLEAEEAQFMLAVMHNWHSFIGEIYGVEFSYDSIPIDEFKQMEEKGEVDTGSAVPGNIPRAFFHAGKTHLFVDELLYVCKEEINPQARWWGVERGSSLEELASEMRGWIGWLNMRLVPEGEEGEVVQLYPRLDYLPPEEIDFEELRRLGTYSILKEAFWLRGVEEMRPLQLVSSLAHLGCDIEWGIGSRNAPVENQLQGIPEKCMKWLDFTVVKHLDGDEVLLSMKE